MSTKTTFKRVALVAVAALSMGVLTSVAPASAAVVNTTMAVGALTVTDAAESTAVGTSFAKSPKTLRKVLDPHGIHIHSLRHTYAYILKSQGIHVTTAQKLMGHSDPKITMAIYTRVLDNEIESAGAILRRMTG